MVITPALAFAVRHQIERGSAILLIYYVIANSFRRKYLLEQPFHVTSLRYVHLVTRCTVAYQKLNHKEEGADQPWGEQSSDESSSEDDEVRVICS